MKVIFLDFDGVLNPKNSSLPTGVFSKPACENLNKILKNVPQAKIVVSSSWRTNGLEAVKDILKTNGVDSSKVVDIVGNERGDRGHQIKCWLKRNPKVKQFVILDDKDDFPEFPDNLVKINPFIGLTVTEVDLAEEILNK